MGASLLVKCSLGATVDLVDVEVGGGAVDRGQYCREQWFLSGRCGSCTQRPDGVCRLFPSDADVPGQFVTLSLNGGLEGHLGPQDRLGARI